MRWTGIQSDPARRWIAPVASGVAYLLLGLFAGFASAFIAASPPLLIQAVAGLALLSSLAGAVTSGDVEEDDGCRPSSRFVTTASGVGFLGSEPPSGVWWRAACC